MCVAERGIGWDACDLATVSLMTSIESSLQKFGCVLGLGMARLWGDECRLTTPSLSCLVLCPDTDAPTASVSLTPHPQSHTSSF